MKNIQYIFYTGMISPHQMPWARLFDKLVANQFLYIANKMQSDERKKLGWEKGSLPEWVIVMPESLSQTAQLSEDKEIISSRVSNNDEIEALLEQVVFLITSIRDFKLMERRVRRGIRTYYVSERWFKPPLGILRLFEPRYLYMCWKFVRLLKDKDEKGLNYLPIGIYAAADMARLIGLFGGDWRCLFKAPCIQVETPTPLSKIRLRLRAYKNDNAFKLQEEWTQEEERYGLHKMRLWGYFVEESKNAYCARHTTSEEQENLTFVSGKSTETNDEPTAPLLHVLWVGRMLEWKRVETLVKATVRLLDQKKRIKLKIVGIGPAEQHLRRLAGQYLYTESLDNTELPYINAKQEGISFYPPVAITEVRRLMQEADVYVLPSDGGEGWGAVINEAMAEGCCVVGTHEAGASATMIQDGKNGLLFHAGDVAELVVKLKMCFNTHYRLSLINAAKTTIEDCWSPLNGAKELSDFLGTGCLK